MIYESTNNGLLTLDDVKEGDILIISSEVYSTFNEAKQKTYWNGKVKLPSGDEKLAGFMDSTLDGFARVWGKETSAWIGNQVQVNIKNSKTTGNPYITMLPITGAKVEVEEEIDPNDIPF